jgi:hypothetical protein
MTQDRCLYEVDRVRVHLCGVYHYASRASQPAHQSTAGPAQAQGQGQADAEALQSPLPGPAARAASANFGVHALRLGETVMGLDGWARNASGRLLCGELRQPRSAQPPRLRRSINRERRALTGGFGNAPVRLSCANGRGCGREAVTALFAGLARRRRAC